MTQKASPSSGHVGDPVEAAYAIDNSGGNSTWIPTGGDTPTQLASDDGDITQGNLAGFGESHSASSFDVTIDPGEGFHGGAWFVKDTSTTVTLAASTNNQTVYAGWDISSGDTVIIGLDSAFASGDPKTAIWDFDTDGSGVTSATDQRTTLKTTNPEQIIDGADISHTGELADFDDLFAAYGDGSDGSITRSSNANENGVIQATDYTVNSSVTLTVSSGVLVVFATNSITINGTIDANGQGASGGAGGAGGNNAGNPGSSGLVVPIGTGGAGGSGGSSGGDGGDGGDGDTNSTVLIREMFASFDLPLDKLESINGAGAGGGGGGGGNIDGSALASTGNSGNSPGGGGEGNNAQSGTETPGGDGGAGGGFVLLAAPRITMSGAVTADGDPGQDSSGQQPNPGGGGGGSGGVVLLVGSDIDSTGTLSVAAGSGGSGGGNGASGATGFSAVIQ